MSSPPPIQGSVGPSAVPDSSRSKDSDSDKKICRVAKTFLMFLGVFILSTGLWGELTGTWEWMADHGWDDGYGMYGFPSRSAASLATTLVLGFLTALGLTTAYNKRKKD